MEKNNALGNLLKVIGFITLIPTFVFFIEGKKVYDAFEFGWLLYACILFALGLIGVIYFILGNIIQKKY